MMKSVNKLNGIFFSSLLLLIFFLEDLGFTRGRNLAFNLILIMPFFLFARRAFTDSKKPQIIIPKILSIVFLLFFFFSSLSVIFSANVQRSFEYLLFYLAIFLIFIYTYNYRKQLNQSIIILIFILSFLFTAYSFLLTFNHFSFLIPKTGYNLVYPFYQTHNLLGDFLVAPMILCLYYLLTKSYKLPFITISIVLLPFYLLSYARSAYLSVTLTLVMMSIYLIKTKQKAQFKQTKTIIMALGLTGIIISLSIFFTIATVEESKLIGNLYYVTQFLKEHTNLVHKTFIASRDVYFKQALNGFIEKPWFGWGANNFVYVSKKFMEEPNQLSYSSHNLFMDFIVENGLIAGSLFAGFIILIFYHGWKFKKRKDIMLFFASLALIINFQVNYTFNINSIFLLFFVIVGLFYREKRKDIIIKATYLTGISILILIPIIAINLSSVLVKKQKYELAVNIYPLNQKAYQPLIRQQKAAGNKRWVFKLISKYQRLFPEDPQVMEFIGDVYLEYGNKEKALFYYNKAYYDERFNTLQLIKKRFTLLSE